MGRRAAPPHGRRHGGRPAGEHHRPFALDNLQLRGELFVGPGEVVYEGMVVGENSRSDEMVVNAVRAKEKTNIRTHCHDDGAKLAPPRVHTLETAIEFIADDELVEVTPTAVRIRKRLLTEAEDRAGGPTKRARWSERGSAAHGGVGEHGRRRRAPSAGGPAAS